MYNRRLFPVLEAHLQERFVTTITGMRRVGKSTALHFLMQKVSHDNKIYLDLERVENRYIFQQNSYKDIQMNLGIEGIDFSKPAVIALDEIQLVKDITSVIKWFYDTYPLLKFIVTGSSSFYLRNRFSESLAGRKHIFEMYPLDFLEFLWFKEIDTSVIERFSFQPFQPQVYEKFNPLYMEYLQFGGFPDVVKATNTDSKARTLNDIINAYIDLDVRLLSDFDISGTLYKLIRLLAARTGTLLDVSKISSALGVDRRKVTGYLELLEKTYVIHLVSPYSKNVDREISLRRKIYLADTGILQQLAQVSSGQVFENQVFLQLMKRGSVAYYQRKSRAEIDFVFNGETAIEVKETCHAGDLTTLQKRAHSIQLAKTMLVGNTLPGDQFKDFTWAGTLF
jgi:predicted AAA+ superfamily ATPase